MKRSRDVDGTLIFWISREAAAEKSRGPAKRRKAARANSATVATSHTPGPSAGSGCCNQASVTDNIPARNTEPTPDTSFPANTDRIVGVMPIRAKRVRGGCRRVKAPRKRRLSKSHQLVPLSDNPVSQLKVILYELGSTSGRSYERYMGIPDHDFLLVDTSINTRHKSKEVLSVITIESCDQEEGYTDEYGPLGTDDYLKEIEGQLIATLDLY